MSNLLESIDDYDKKFQDAGEYAEFVAIFGNKLKDLSRKEIQILFSKYQQERKESMVHAAPKWKRIMEETRTENSSEGNKRENERE